MIMLMSYMIMSMPGVIMSMHLHHTTEGHPFDKGVNPQGGHYTEEKSRALMLMRMGMAVFNAVREEIENHL